jgi:nitrite reductase/ring-hydroxylating ferredoxin subunit
MGGLPQGAAAGVSDPAPRLHATPAGVTLGPLDFIPDGTARGFVLEMRAGRFHGFVVRRGGQVYGYVDRCPHAGLPLARSLDDYLTPVGELIACGWHSALFDIETGACKGGPCMGASLTPWPVAVAQGLIVTAAPRGGC